MQTEQDLEKLVHAYTAPLLRYCTAMLGSEADAQDAVQTTFVKAWLRLAICLGAPLLLAAGALCWAGWSSPICAPIPAPALPPKTIPAMPSSTTRPPINCPTS